MKLVGVVCRVVEDDGSNHLENVEPSLFLDMLSEAGQAPEDEIAALEAELATVRGAATPSPMIQNVPIVTMRGGGEIILPRSAAEPIVGAKTRGEVYEKLDELLALVGARLAREGEL